ncbi:MAG: hypothetical protein JW929_05180 [Anaerolineales bacterium]|nr:hypothetical protein [Anaerolineales bacterium]
MAAEPLFLGLVFSEDEIPLTAAQVGGEPFYVLNDAGFLRHIRARDVDEAVLRWLWEQIRGHEKELAEQAARMTGQEDIFSRAALQSALAHPETHVEEIFRHGLPESTRMWMGMMGFRAVVNVRGELLRVDQPARAPEEGEG